MADFDRAERRSPPPDEWWVDPPTDEPTDQPAYPPAGRSLSAVLRGFAGPQTTSSAYGSALDDLLGRPVDHLAAEVAHTALHDPLTGLANRTLLVERLGHALHRNRRCGTLLALLSVDLDPGPLVDRPDGHQLGDELLIAAAGRLTELLRAGDTLARVAGDELVVLCEDLRTAEELDPITERVAAALRAPFELSVGEVFVGATLGVAVAAGDAVPDHLLRDAGGAGRRRSAGTPDARAHPPGMLTELPGAIERGELRTEYQPIVDTADGRITGVEALLRWAHPDHGTVGPDAVVPVAEAAGLMAPIGMWMLERACRDRQDWARRHGQAGLGVSVNVSASQLAEPGFAAEVAQVLATTATDPGLVTLELTETEVVEDDARARDVLHDLKDVGVRLALDDFGTGYSTLTHLHQFPVDEVKVDRRFVTDIDRDPGSRAIVAAVVSLARDLGMAVVAEGVETVEQHGELHALDCGSCQGFYFARPMPADDLGDLLDDDEHLPPGPTVALP